MRELNTSPLDIFRLISVIDALPVEWCESLNTLASTADEPFNLYYEIKLSFNDKNLNGYSVLNSSQFAKEVANMEISDDEVMVSFDVVSLFTAIPVNKACDYIRNKLNNDSTLQSRTSLTTDDIISLLDFTLSNNYFVYNNCIYKQVHLF